MSLADTLHGPRTTATMFVALAAFWGTSFVAIQTGLHAFPPLLFAALRFGIAGLVVLGYAAYTTARWFPRTRAEWLQVTIGGVLVIAVYHGLLYLGERHVPGAVAAVIVSLAPILTAVFASLVLSEDSIGGVELVGFGLGILGVVAIAAPGGGALAGVGLVPVGLVVLGTATFALGGVLTRPLATSLPLRSMQAWTMLVGAALLFGGAGLRGESFAAIHWTPGSIASLAYLTGISGVLAFLLYFELLDRAGPSTVHLVSYLEPVVATVMSVALLGQGVGPTTAVGFLAVFTGFVVVERDRFAVFDDARERARLAYVRLVHSEHVPSSGRHGYERADD
ncbi:DMT family transporter [Halarchaeum nitratireducens]|uniref:EamA family transporter n=1 Tax=Halarchaeum nitratireducens TaxID=489913 RepID=A0A830GCL9_9EURY|nr:EamA family transporter [Halarchaeum nitratireducens]GGN20035.1 EamA family transporter [Halarchaeum nitratireducens]